MSRIQWAIFPAIILGIFFVILATSLIGNPQVVLAANLPTQSRPAGLRGGGGQPDVTDPNAIGDPTPPTPPSKSKAGSPQATAIPEVEPIFVSGTILAPQGSSGGNNQGCSLSSQFSASVLQWCGIIEKYALQNGLEPSLIAALITQESGGDPNAYSSSGAVGLMQVMPSDGLAASFMCVSGPCFSARPTTQELLNPEYNIAYGVKMLSALQQKHGSLREALKNYGPIDVGYYYADLVLGIFNSKQ